MKVLVCGGRDYTDADRVCRELDGLRPLQVIHGGARGADLLADAWAMHNDVSRRVFNADWDRHGRAAGPIRNTQMLKEGQPDLVVAFPGGRGTADMVKQARAAGIKVMEIAP